MKMPLNVIFDLIQLGNDYYWFTDQEFDAISAFWPELAELFVDEHPKDSTLHFANVNEVNAFLDSADPDKKASFNEYYAFRVFSYNNSNQVPNIGG